MSWSSGIVRNALIALAILAPLAACSSFRPVYGDVAGIGAENHVFRYDEPASRLEQIIYSDLRLRLGAPSADPEAVRVSITTATYKAALTKTAVTRPTLQYEATVYATIRVISPKGEALFYGRRSATADFGISNQVLADRQAENDAYERAARTLGDEIRLVVLAALEYPRNR